MRFLRFWGICEIGRVGCGQYFFLHSRSHLGFEDKARAYLNGFF